MPHVQALIDGYLKPMRVRTPFPPLLQPLTMLLLLLLSLLLLQVVLQVELQVLHGGCCRHLLFVAIRDSSITQM